MSVHIPRKVEKKLLSGTEFLKHPDFNKNPMNQFERLFRCVLMAYLKHHCGNDDIGWSELSDALQNEICNTIGDTAFCEWLDRMTSAEVET